ADADTPGQQDIHRVTEFALGKDRLAGVTQPDVCLGHGLSSHNAARRAKSVRFMVSPRIRHNTYHPESFTLRGYNLFSLTRASAVVKYQSALGRGSKSAASRLH